MAGMTAFLSDLLIASVPLEFDAPYPLDECQSRLEGISRKAQLFIRPGLQVTVSRESANTAAFRMNETGSKATLHMVGSLKETAPEWTSIQGQVQTDTWVYLIFILVVGLILSIGIGIEANSTRILFLGPLLVVCGVLAVAVLARLVNHPRELALIHRVEETLDVR